ncbi:GDSL-like Lipase/Acylhydrolase superfamily protein [Striga asiatica]|uniref:GDSL-like Lipase/Acylhydrolase superfamily protein n=1 Tax=Striga asiatica TaxID=4170 RepID=A0A5A7RKR4_STRAF|nr:GDSL-like Lipase/Acylhydrolase superfamily protein [Striga asiatica]
MSAAGYISISGTHAPWSSPRLRSTWTGPIPDPSRSCFTLAPSWGDPGAGYRRSYIWSGKPARDGIDRGLGGLPVAGDDEDGGGAVAEDFLLEGFEEMSGRERIVYGEPAAIEGEGMLCGWDVLREKLRIMQRKREAMEYMKKRDLLVCIPWVSAETLQLHQPLTTMLTFFWWGSVA